MIHPTIQWIAIVATFLATGIFAYYEQWWEAGISLLVALLLVYSKARFGTVYIALRYLYKGNTQKTEQTLQKISNPDKLNAAQRAYYHFCWGYLKMGKQNFEGAQPHFEKALEFGLKMKNDAAVAHISLADIFIRQGDQKAAQFHLGQAEEMKHNEAVDKAIAQVKSRLK